MQTRYQLSAASRGPIPLHLSFQRADRGIDGCQLAFHAVPPELQHAQLALLMTPPAASTAVVNAATAAQEGKHEKVGKVIKVLASLTGLPSVVFLPQQWPRNTLRSDLFQAPVRALNLGLQPTARHTLVRSGPLHSNQTT